MTVGLMASGLSAALLAGAAAAAPAPVARPDYVLAKSVALGAPDRWDYVISDPATRRVYVAHADRLTVVDPAAGTVVGEVAGITGGTHGTAVSLATGEGFTDDGRAGRVVVFDLHTLKVKQTIPAAEDADGIARDPASGHLFVIEGDHQSISVIDPRSDRVAATIALDEGLEYGVADGHGALFVAGNGKGDVIRIDTRTNKVSARWPTPGCTSPHGLALDPRGRRVFMGCSNNVLMVVDSASGKTVARLAIGSGSDGVAFDPVRRRVFSSNGRDGTITAYQQVTPDRYAALATIPTMVSGRTMDVDPASGRLFVAAAETGPSATPGGRPSIRPGTLRLMIFEPRR